MELKRQFLIFGLPRSMTAWLSCFLTCGPVFCQHELTGKLNSAAEIADNLRAQPFPFSGMADPGALMIWPELTELLPHATLIYIRRNPLESRRSLARVSGVDPAVYSGIYGALLDRAREFLHQCEPRVLEFHDLTQEHWLRVLWGWVAGETPLPDPHLRKMLSLHVRQRDEIIRDAALHGAKESAIC